MRAYPLGSEHTLPALRCAAGDEISSKQLRDDLMTLLIAGHETTAAVLTWTMYLLAQHPEAVERIRAEVRREAATQLA